MAATRDKKSGTITKGTNTAGYLRGNCIEDGKKVVRITPELAEAIARQKLPFSERNILTLPTGFIIPIGQMKKIQRFSGSAVTLTTTGIIMR